MISQFFKDVYAAISALTLETALYICWGAFLFVFLLALVLTIFNAGVRRADKRPYLAMVNVFAAVTFALALTFEGLSFSVLISAVFWCFAYLSYGLIVLLSRRKKNRQRYALPDVPPPAESFKPSVRPAKTNVRTEHALAVTEKLLEKDLGRGDREEAEKIRSALGFMRMKGELSPEDNERLNDDFNTLLKLMGKYKM